MNFQLESQALGLDEIVVTGTAGASRRREIGNTISQINVDDIPADTFAPNLEVSGVLGRDRSRFAEVPVPHTPRRTGQVSIAGLGAVRAAATSLAQTLVLARRLRRSGQR